ncbi:MAG: aldehyde dehydrogenase family protein [Fidelibacterota bacterium]
MTPEISIDPEIQKRIDAVFSRQLEHRRTVSLTSVQERRAKLKRILDWLLDHRQEIQRAMEKDYAKPPSEVDLSEIWAVVSEIRHIRRRLKRWMKPRKVAPTLPLLTAEGWIQYEPKGVVLIISPWNFPFNLTLSPLISAIAAGNCAILKPSEFTPHSAALMETLVTDLFPEEEIALFQGDRFVAETLLAKPFHHIFFTGSPEVGKKVMAAAAHHLTTVTLELGGKSPTIVDRTANLKVAADKIAWGKYFNCGQVCLAPDYLLVETSVVEPFLDHLKAAVKQKFAGGGDFKHSPDYGRIVNQRHHRRLTEVLTKTLEQGAELVLGGEVDPDQAYMEPTIVRSVTPESPLMETEIFGPILPVLTFESLDEALDLINQKPKPLGLYIFSRNRKTIKRILAETSAGGTSINEVILHYFQLNLPFGGINNSGFGRSHGEFGFKAFSNERAVMRNMEHSPLKILHPPYTPFVKKVIDWTLKYF